MNRIDAHHHLWRYDADRYPWIDGDLTTLRRDFWMDELRTLASDNGVDGFVTVQAHQSLDETRTLLELAAESPNLIRGVVGWVPMTDPALADTLSDYDGSALVGVRHVIQDEPDDEFWTGRPFLDGLGTVARAGLRYDLLIYGRQLNAARTLVDAHEGLPIVVDHAAKPTIAPEAFDVAWAAGLRELARRPNVWCKWSGLASEVVGVDWTIDTLRRYFDLVVEAFTPARIMFGSDWPVCLPRTSYDRWASASAVLVSDWTDDERAGFWSANAIEFYGLGSGDVGHRE